jgi:DNA polymerase-3 subunit beta
LIFTVERNKLHDVTRRAVDIIKRAQILPILSNIKMVANERYQTLVVSVSDLDREITTTIPAEVKTDGATSVPGEAFHKIISGLVDGSAVQVRLGDRCSITSGRSRYTLATLDPRDFPHLSEPNDMVTFTMSAKDLIGLIDSTIFATSKGGSHYWMAGCHIHTLDGSLVVVGTDAYTFARRTLPFPNRTIPPVTIATEALATAAKLAKGAGEITISLAANQARFEADQTTFITKVVDVDYPHYQRIIQPIACKGFRCHRLELITALQRLGSVDEEDKANAICIEARRDHISLSQPGTSLGDAVEEVDAEIIGDFTPSAIGRLRMINALQRFEGGRVLFDQGAPHMPMRFLPVDEVDEGFDCQVAAMRVAVSAQEAA